MELEAIAEEWSMRLVELLKEVSGEETLPLGWIEEGAQAPPDADLVVCCGLKPPNWKGWKLRLSHQLLLSPSRSIFVMQRVRR